MKRLFALALWALIVAAGIVACGGGGDETASANKLTIVGAGS
jgi:ABC-type glycerol-3-phosphate transport system substrate-binding protein